MNLVYLVGRCGKDPVYKSTQSGLSVVEFSLATSHKSKEQWVTEWHNVIAFGRLVDDIRDLFRSGSELFISGKINTRSWEGKDGKKHYKTSIIADTIRVCQLRPKQQESIPSFATNADSNVMTDEDVPF